MKLHLKEWFSKIHPVQIIGWIVLAALLIGYVEYRNNDISHKLAEIQEQTVAADARNQQAIDTLNTSIGTLASQDASLVSKIDSTKEQNAAVADQIGKVSATVGSLDKLSKMDPELLQKYSKVYFLNEHYTPPALSTLEPQYVYNKDVAYQLHSQVAPHLVKMIDKAKAAGSNLLVVSAFRSFGTQAALKSSYKVTYGAGTANSFSADQGYSEHQLGTTVDLTTPAIGTTDDAFDKTPEFKWLTEHAHEYGFTLSYPKNNSYYVYEPWHWRYVGVDLATKIKREGKYFYDLDQRIIDNYLLVLFD